MGHCGRKWGMKMLMGEFHHNLDDKGRLIIPSKFRNELGERIIITRGLDNCLFAYSESEWQKIVKKLNTLSSSVISRSALPIPIQCIFLFVSSSIMSCPS